MIRISTERPFALGMAASRSALKRPASGEAGLGLVPPRDARPRPRASTDRPLRRRGSRGSRPARARGRAARSSTACSSLAAADQRAAWRRRDRAARDSRRRRRCRSARARLGGLGREQLVERVANPRQPVGDPGQRRVCLLDRVVALVPRRCRRSSSMAAPTRSGAAAPAAVAWGAGASMRGASTPSSSASSPDSNISVTMSQPPTSSPLDEQLRDRRPAREVRELLADARVGQDVHRRVVDAERVRASARCVRRSRSAGRRECPS